MSPFLLHHIGRQTGMDEKQLKATMTSAVEGRISAQDAESAAISAAASHFAKQRRTHRAGTSRRGSVQATWVRNKRNSWEQTRPLMLAAQKNGRAAVWPEQGGGRKAHQRRNCWQGGLRISDRSPSRRSPFSNAAHKAGRADGDQVKGALFSAADGDF